MGRWIKSKETVDVNIHQSGKPRCCCMVRKQCIGMDFVSIDKIISQSPKLKAFKTSDCKTLPVNPVGHARESLSELPLNRFYTLNVLNKMQQYCKLRIPLRVFGPHGYKL